ncbi:hypothetical protein PIB30_009925 [Stylosanthes scabra]|uniref:Pre-rRNA-processing protein TSR2 homolog n=1 Tax=Stylosanthes scabra TaxID=79078 RepID=A0ABU6S5J4_9FABA|nr:hypothetical protein [Stylosanthes scabra]
MVLSEPEFNDDATPLNHHDFVPSFGDPTPIRPCLRCPNAVTAITEQTLITNRHSNPPIPSNFHSIPCAAPLIRIISHTLSPPPPKPHIRRRLHCLLTPAPSALPHFETPRRDVAVAGFPFSRRHMLLTVALIPPSFRVCIRRGRASFHSPVDQLKSSPLLPPCFLSFHRRLASAVAELQLVLHRLLPLLRLSQPSSANFSTPLLVPASVIASVLHPPSLALSRLLLPEKSRDNFDPFVSRVPSRKKRMEGAKRLQGNSLSVFSEGIGFVLLRWSALRDAVENEWGGPDSRIKADNLATDIFSWFTQSREPLYIDDLEDKLYDGMISLNVVVEDGSIEEVAENLMVMHEECLEGNFATIEHYRQAILNQASHSRAAPQIVNNDDDDEEDDDVQGSQNVESSARQAATSSNMDVDIPKSDSNMNSGNMPVDDGHAGEAEDGWVVVSKKKNKPRKN